MEKQWKKRQEIWDQEERARVKLIHEVYADRENALRYKKGLNNQELVEKAEEKDELHVFVEKFHTEEKRQELEDIMRAKQHQNALLWQVNEKTEKRREDLVKGMEDERQRRLNDLNYERRIREELHVGKAKVQEAKHANSLF